MRYVVLLALLSGCGTIDFNVKAGDVAMSPDSAAQFEIDVWAAYGATNYEKPYVVWVGPGGLNCPNGHSFMYNNGCDDGLYNNDTNIAYIALPDGWKVTQTALAHEFCHARSLYMTGDSDHDHWHAPCFNPDHSLGTATDMDGTLIKSINKSEADNRGF